MLRFIISLWVSKLCLFVFKLTGREKDDRPGILALRLCDDFIDRVKKPRLVVAVTGTNGKTTISNLVSDILKLEGKKVAYNTWGANYKAGQARCLLDAVNIFNRPTKDAAIVEVDELLSYKTLPWIQPNYIIVTNICRDSIRRNAHQEYIFNSINKGLAMVPKAKLILNADDPVSSFLGETYGGSGAEDRLPNKRIYFSIADQKQEVLPTNVSDFPVCPKCGTKPEFLYRHYRDIGKFRCPKCGLTSKEPKYIGNAIDFNEKKICVSEAGKKENCYPLVSDTIFNAFNIVAIITLFRELGLSSKKIAEDIGKIKIPESRMTSEECNGIKISTFTAKGQNVSAASTVFEYLAKEPSAKELILLLDEHYGDDTSIETITWLYESDFENLNNPNIKKIIVAGHRYLDYRLRLKLAGIPEEKVVCVRDENTIPEYVEFDGIESIYVLHDVYTVSKAKNIKERIKERMSK